MIYSLAKRKSLYNWSQEKTGRLTRLAAVVCVLCLCVLFPFPNHQFAQGGENPTSNLLANMASGTRADTSKILTALEIKADNERPIELVKAKLLTLDDRQARLLSRLSERITADDKSPGSGIAFLLTAVLIILS
jgi:hypothetical protein